MGYRERRAKLWAKVAGPHLEPGEQIQTGFIGQLGSGIFTSPAVTVVVTDRAILVVSRSDGSVQRLPRDFRFGKPTGLYHEIEFDHRTYKVHRQYHPELIAADEALREMQARSNPPESEQR
jgi:hypothetical protein